MAKKPKPKKVGAKLRQKIGAAKRTPDQRATDLLLISEMAAQGYTCRAICDVINEQRKGSYKLSTRTIDEDLRLIREEWAKARVFNLNEFVTRELNLLDYIQTEALEGWKKSKLARTRTEVEDANFQKGVRRAGKSTKKSTEDRDGSPEFLITAVKCHERRCRLLGLEKPIKQELGGIDGAPLPIANSPHVLEIKILSADESASITATGRPKDDA